MTASLLAQIAAAVRGSEFVGQAGDGGVFASPLFWAAVLFGLGLWLCLPRGGAGGRGLGLVLTIASLGLFAFDLPLLDGWLDHVLFTALGVVTVTSCAATIISRDPVYAAIWFGMALLGTAGLFLLSGAQFLSVATVTVYAGAILVTFLFVIMLAQPRGHAFYDRVSWEAFLSAGTGAILVGLLTTVIGRGVGPAAEGAATLPVIADAERKNADLHGVLAENHVAHLGQELLGRHLITMQAAGGLMLAALVGAVAIVTYGRRAAAAVELASGPLFRSSQEASVFLMQRELSPATQEKPGGLNA